MDDLMGKLQDILGSEEGQAQLKSVAQMLGVGDAAAGDSPAPAPDAGGFDLSALAGLMSSMAPPAQETAPAPPEPKEPEVVPEPPPSVRVPAQAPPTPESAQNTGLEGLDMSAIAGLLQGLGGAAPAPPPVQPPPQPPAGNIDLSALAGLFGGGAGTGSPPPSAGPDLSGIDLNMIMKIQQAVGSMNMEDENTRLLTALKPHFSDKRQEKVDKAIKMMRLLSLLPLIQESGILGGLLGDGGSWL